MGQGEHHDKIDPEQLLYYLQWQARGKAKAVSGKQIAARFRASDTKRVRETVSILRSRHIPICSDQDGYWYPVSREDAAAAIHHLTVLFRPLRESYEGFLAGLNETFGEPTLFDQEAVND